MPTTENLPTQDPVIANASVTARESAQDHIVIRGARQHNLKDVDLDLPRNELLVEIRRQCFVDGLLVSGPT